MKMKAVCALAAVAGLLLGGAGIQAIADEGKKQEFKAKLSGAEENPPVTTETSGKAEIVFNADETKGDYELKVRKGVRVTQSHIHCAPKGVNGPVVVFLAGFHNRGWDVDGTWVENASFTDANVMPPAPGSTCPHVINNLRDLAVAIRAGNTYVNVHSVANPGGEVRGQLQVEHDEDEDN
jgi:hypothetical protein